MEIFPNTSKIMTDVISPFNENSQKLTNLAYAITIPVPSNTDDENQTNIPPFMRRPPKSHMQKPFHNSIRELHGGHNIYGPFPVNSPPRSPQYPIRPPPPPSYMEMDGPMGGPMPPYPINMDVDNGYINGGFPPPFQGPYPINHFGINDYNANNKNSNHKNNSKKNHSVAKSFSNKSSVKGNTTVTSHNNNNNNNNNTQH